MQRDTSQHGTTLGAHPYSGRFFWGVHIGGYQWTSPLHSSRAGNVGSSAQIELEELRLTPRSSRTREYAPLEKHNGLFWTFADTERTPAGVLSFANRFGLLRSPSREESDEPLAFWTSEIRAMQEAVETWQPLRADESKSVIRNAIAHGGAQQIGPGTSKFPNAVSAYAAVEAIQDLVHARLHDGVLPYLVLAQGQARPVLTQIPQSLQSALWLQFALALSANKSYRRCEICGSWFEAAPNLTRTSKLFCSNACRYKAYRERKAQAQQLHEEGASDEEIAAKLGSEVRVVQGWISRLTDQS